MSHDRLVTVATFATAVEADLARNLLAEEGVAAYLECGALVEMVWMLGNAVGGVKLQVAEDDVPRAREILDRTAGAIEAAPAETDYGDRDEPQLDEEPAPELPGDLLATRAWRAAVIGLFACPPLLHFYSAWTLLRLSFSGQPLSPAGTAKFYLALVLDVAVCAAVGVFIAMLRN
jgi:hypothetical protein